MADTNVTTVQKSLSGGIQTHSPPFNFQIIGYHQV